MADPGALIEALRLEVQTEARAIESHDAAALSASELRIAKLIGDLTADPPQEPALIAKLGEIHDTLTQEESALRETVQRHGLQLQELMRAGARSKAHVVDRLA